MIWVGKNLAEQGVISCIYYTRDIGQGITRGVFWVLKHPPKLFAIFLVSQLCLFVQQNIFRLRLLNIKKCKNFLKRGTPPRRLRRLDLRAYGAQAQRDTLEKNPSYGVDIGEVRSAIVLAYAAAVEGCY